MDALARDDVIHSIDQALSFYGKKLDQISVRFWLSAMEPYEPEEVRRALLNHTKVGRHAPKPADLTGFLDVERARRKSQESLPEPEYVPCPPEIAQAWRWLLAHSTRDSSFPMFPQHLEATPEQQEQYLLTCNQEAKRLNMPEAIPEGYRVAEVW